MASRSHALYIGMTNDLLRRLYEHKHSLVEGFSCKYQCKILIYYEHFFDVNACIEREKQLKKWSRSKKIKLIESFNPSWKDLSSSID